MEKETYSNGEINIRIPADTVMTGKHKTLTEIICAHHDIGIPTLEPPV